MNDQILLDRIKKLETENNKLRVKSVKWQTVVRNIGHWFRAHAEDIGLASIPIIFFGSIALLVAWLSGGWPTDKFYLEFGTGGSSGGACIYQKYDWGKDATVVCSYGVAERPNYVGKIEMIRNEWIKSRGVGEGNE